MILEGENMYKRIIFVATFFVFQPIFTNQENNIHVQKQLRLHFDINKTIIAMDAVQGKGLEETINGILAEFTFAQWDGKHEQSYYAYLSDRLAYSSFYSVVVIHSYIRITQS